MRLHLRDRLTTMRRALHHPAAVPAAERLLERHRDELPPRLYVG
ncbi:hypothetical protein OHA72_48210 [Dactylosporangium sp. NBC_01737]|jgi:hypothetical protein|nr:hypothetical protein OHA72_48210 [Dactylosporangium sp. NBC_01737]